MGYISARALMSAISICGLVIIYLNCVQRYTFYYIYANILGIFQSNIPQIGYMEYYYCVI